MSDGIDGVLFNEVRGDLRKLTDQMGRMNANFEHWSPIWAQQLNGMTDLANRQTKQDMEIDNLRKQFNSELELLRKQIISDRASDHHVDEELERAQEQRTVQLRWVIGMAFVAAGFGISLLAFLILHVSLK